MHLVNENIKELLKERTSRLILCEKSLAYFTFYYLANYLQYDVPEFHWEIYKDVQDTKVNFTEIIAFRESAKSTIASLALPLWSAVYNKKKFIILCSDTGMQAKTIIANLIRELEWNERIQDDFGNFKDDKKGNWTSTNLSLNNDVRIMARSKGQQIRGLRHLEHRPDLIVLDDIESIEDVRTKEQRDKTEDWVMSDIIPASDPKIGKIVLIGNYLHNDSIMMRMKKRCIENNYGVVKEYPLIDSNDKCLWEEKFTPEIINKLKVNPDNPSKYFLREYLLKLIPDEGQVVEKIVYYTKVTTPIKRLAIGTDLAISQKETADYTAFNVAGEGEDGNIYNLYSYHGRLSFNDTLAKLNSLYQQYRLEHPNIPLTVGWEDVGYQRAGAEEATRRYRIPIKLIKRAKDKRSRLQTIEPHYSSGHVKFREVGDEELAIEILGFGMEAHDDLMDAAEMAHSMLVTIPKPDIAWL